MEERTIHLKVKVMSLAAEARIIRQQARKAKGMVKWRLNEHRTDVVRVHARHNGLAYGILRGTPYSAIEKKCDKKPDFEKVATIAKRFGSDEKMVSAWVEKAEAYLEPPKEMVA